ncbi:MAG: methyltransferase domain-containing protein [Alphaproteobacteria bacterium]|nr:methyltransferase domain-containing protein [Alphaproteobacteria bacterium]MDE2109784.1 methyltransferase domain-containing protein [Alphaproteobacteria bacterium]MDE2495671.1 methyltransferase domain-containing protein [Alphaproteobacteria bacterium]
MQLDAGNLADFYESALGQAARRLIFSRIKLMWPQQKGLRVLGYGFAVPYLKPYLNDAERVVALMPAQTGVVAWPAARPLTVLGEEGSLPFADAMFDRILVVHGLEGADGARALLRQLWRVLAPEGRLLVVAPNRASLWAQVDASPFACGRPFHRSELAALLQDTLFESLHWDRALYMPPLRGRRLSRTGAGWERLGRRLLPGIAGVHLVEASKSLYGIAKSPRLRHGEPVLTRALGISPR